jgi:pyruvate/2-oxoglutarate dehydrogenase complex dihydrolipoamide acyltransferase (E2) component
MLTPVHMPDLGARGAPMFVTVWFADLGDTLEKGESLLEAAISGVTCDVASPCGGRVMRIERDLDAEVIPGDIVCWIETPDGAG